MKKPKYKPTSRAVKDGRIVEPPKLKAIGITCGVGSMLVGARQAGFEVLGNVEWRKYYHANDGEGHNTFVDNFGGAPFPHSREQMTEEEFKLFSNPDLAMGHPESFRPDAPVYTSRGWRPIGEITEGDLVLTHRGRFRRVYRTIHYVAPPDTDEITFSRNSRKSGSAFVTTGNHPILMGDSSWRPAREVRKGEQITFLCETCERCGELTPVSATGRPTCYCAVKEKWEGLTPEEKRERLAPAFRATRKKIARGEHDFTKVEVRHKGQLVQGMRSPAEAAIADVLTDVDLERQYPVGPYSVDLAIPHLKIAVEVDGGCWHQTSRKQDQDIVKEAYLHDEGWTVVRVQVRIDRLATEPQQRRIAELAAEVRRLAANHDGEYQFASFKVGGLWRSKFRDGELLCNLGVEEDETYIVRGVVVHNCGNFSLLGSVNKGAKEKLMDPTDIPLFIDLVAQFRPRFFVMDDLPRSFGAFPMSEYTKRLPDYDLFPEWVSNWGYGNVQRHRDRMFMLGSLKKERWVFRPGEEEHADTLATCIGDMAEPGKSNLANHYPAARREKAQKNFSMRFKGDRPTWAEVSEYAKTSWKPGQSMTYYAEDDTIKLKPGCKIEHWDWHGASVQDGGSYKLHPIRFDNLTLRERARIQGFPDDFIFYGAVLNERGEFNPDKNVHMSKQTGKAMPIQFCRYVSSQVAAHILKEPFASSGKRLLNPNEFVDDAKRTYCETVGYADQKRACGECWLSAHCAIRTGKYKIAYEADRRPVAEPVQKAPPAARGKARPPAAEKPAAPPRAPRPPRGSRRFKDLATKPGKIISF
jgi:site-specific DNA-cytosine methylase/very-short-patch-repair endonuclease